MLTIPAKAVYTIFFTLFALAFILSGYWQVFAKAEQKIVALLSFGLIGMIWAYLGASALHVFKKPGSIWPYLLLTVLLFIVNARPLRADIPWRGDEDFHILTILDWRKLMIDHPEELFATTPSQPAFLTSVVRYPFFQKWFYLAITSISPYEISLYRLIPFLSTLALASIVFGKLKKTSGTFTATLLSFALTTVPLVYFYTSLLYLEMPAILLMTYVLFEQQRIFEEPLENLKRLPAWYAFLLIPFFKEASGIFLLIFLLIRSIAQLQIRLHIATVMKESMVWMVSLTPLLLYLFVRSRIPLERTYPFNFENLFKLSNYGVLSFSLIQQYGASLFLALIGLAFLAFHQKRRTVILIALLFVSTLAFFMMDRPQLIGYSRFNLYLLPMVLFACVYALEQLPKSLHVIVLLFLLGSNVLLTPIHLDGTRKPNWGSPLADTAEYTYPYEQTIRALQSNPSVQHLLLAGDYYYYYGLRFYLEKYHLNPTVSEYYFDTVRFDTTGEKTYFFLFWQKLNDGSDPKLSQVDTIIYHSVNGIDLQPMIKKNDRFSIWQMFRNSEHRLYILKKV